MIFIKVKPQVCFSEKWEGQEKWHLEEVQGRTSSVQGANFITTSSFPHCSFSFPVALCSSFCELPQTELDVYHRCVCCDLEQLEYYMGTEPRSNDFTKSARKNWIMKRSCGLPKWCNVITQIFCGTQVQAEQVILYQLLKQVALLYSIQVINENLSLVLIKLIVIPKEG